ncbi:MAG: glycoside-pentoside-hexuronide (GPH):cation symporter [Bacilli bacterium]|nr:glycoside-pentoside-hexuronide (GPH):cation symporter [Bacilli bacterium]
MDQPKNEYLRRNKWAYSLGGIGRDMTYTLVATFFLTYIQYAGLGLSVQQFAVIGIMLIVGRIWDAINDPMMGTIIENTKSRFGKFKPWILIGAVTTAIVIILMFNVRPLGNDGWNFVIFFGIIYLAWEIAFTMNDISYWSMLPSLSTNPKHRDKITTLAVVFAGVGAFAAHAMITFLTVGDAVSGYSMISIVIALFLVGCQLLTVFGVKEPEVKDIIPQENVSIKKMIRVIAKNDQLLWLILAMLLYNLGSNTLVALGYNFFFLELGYDPFKVTIFIVTFGVSNLSIQALYPKIVNKLGRKKLLWVSLIILAFGYLLLLLMGFVAFLPVNLITICAFGILVFTGQALFYMVLTVNIANTIEYNEFRTGERNEGIIFSLRPFMAKMASALEQGFITLILLVSGIYVLSQNVSELEKQKDIYDNLSVSEQVTYQTNVSLKQIIFDGEEYDELTTDEKNQFYDMLAEVQFKYEKDSQGIDDLTKPSEMLITETANSNFKDLANVKMRLILRLAVTVFPTILVSASYIILKKKFIIDEQMYDNMIAEIKAKKANQ